MKRSKKDDANKQPPFNINISFNINPKNVNQSQNHTSIKIPQNTAQQLQKTNLKSTGTKNPPTFNPNTNMPNSNIKNRPISQYLPAGFEQKKQLQQLKKNFMAKINNIDIVLPSTLINQTHKKSVNLQQSSFMSEKMDKFQPQESMAPALKQHQNLHFNLNSFQASKSKVLNNNAITRAYNIQAKKKDKNTLNKHSLSQVKHQSKLLTHHKGQSCFTDRKYLQKSLKRRKLPKKQAKQENLKEKLQRFKLDLMKLALAYEQNEVLKTKMSSQYHNIRSREISKENVIKITEGQQYEHLQEIRQFQASKNDQIKPWEKRQRQTLTNLRQAVKQQVDQLQFQETESFANFKNIYQGLQREAQRPIQSNLRTYQIIDYYKNLPEDYVQENKETIKNQDRRDIIKQSQQYNQFQQTIDLHKSHQLQRTKQMVDLNIFVQFARRKLGEQKGTHFKEMVENLFKQYINHQQSSESQIEDSFEGKQVMIQEIDNSIDKQLNILPTMREQIANEFDINANLADDLQFWEQNYKSELLRIKGKMWKQYYNIKNQVESRINSGNSSKVIKTKKQNKMNKIMKCLSQKLINKYHPKNESFKYQLQRQTIPNLTAQSSLLKLIQIRNNNSLSQYKQQDQHLAVQMSQQQLSEDQPFNISVSFKNYDAQESILKKQQEIIYKRPQEPQILRKLKEEDKQDIFEFIFLDLCIQIYQNYVQKEGKAQNNSEIKAAERILNRIKQYISEQKSKKKQQQSKRIGISTTINTIRTLLSKLVNFLSNQTFSSAISKKLNSPLGPSQVQILRSLRLPVFEYNQQQQNNQFLQQEDLLVLDPLWFVSFQNQVIQIQQLPFCKYYDSPERDDQRINYLRNCTHIHHKAIYDCLNEHLDYYRAYGLWGKPFSWKIKNQFTHTYSINHTKLALGKAQAQVIRCATFACGLMLNKEQSLIKDIANDPHYVRRIQDERVYKLLQNFVIQMQEKWFFHDDQEAQILIEVSHIIWTIILKEAVKDLVAIVKQ